MQPPGADAHPMSSDHSSDARLDATDETAMTSLVVARAELAAEDIKLFELRHPEGADLPEFTSGAHISVRTPDGKIRKYSLANDPAERSFYQIAVKREAGGRGGSRSMFDALETGDTIPASVPRNDFPLAPSTAGYTLIAGGIGITPILSMARHLKSTGGRFKLYYLTRSREATAFHADLSQPQFRGIVTIPPENLAEVKDELRLAPGMNANVMIPTTARTALSYLIRPFTASFEKAFREK